MIWLLAALALFVVVVFRLAREADRLEDARDDLCEKLAQAHKDLAAVRAELQVADRLAIRQARRAIKLRNRIDEIQAPRAAWAPEDEAPIPLTLTEHGRAVSEAWHIGVGLDETRETWRS